MPDRIKNLLIGIFVATASGIIIFMLLFLHPYIGDEGQTLHVLFVDIEKVNVGTRVLFAGKPVGEVIAIHEVKDATEYRKPINGEIFAYELVLSIDSSVKIYNTDQILLRTAGLLGERSVAIDPEPLKEGQKLNLVGPNDVLYSEQAGSVEETFKVFKEVAVKVETVLEKASNALERLSKEKTWENIGEIARNGAEISDNLKEVSNKIAKGEGTLGQIISKDDLYLRLSSLLSKGETIFDDINHYGLLFQNDKGWQRLRARRMNLLQKLSTPQEFRNYFNDEVDQIQTSLSRVSMVLEQSSTDSRYASSFENAQFTKVYAELMRRVTALEEELRMYNNQLNQSEVNKTELIPQDAYAE